jgi:hypothetical protein
MSEKPMAICDAYQSIILCSMSCCAFFLIGCSFGILEIGCTGTNEVITQNKPNVQMKHLSTVSLNDFAM